ncbi:hypothetical protein CMUS01_14561 [Colletotrichum musicola]|uniref:Uncharacterized protein n=1 Tax=Colletotrichum musicola TaxID=2175873 RepID=A0A8H6J3A7_9PEZI|nr:hypothetical protein CMUS01_14561 [Colletotrichum musicola]
MAEKSLAEHHALLSVDLLGKDGTAVLQYPSAPYGNGAKIKNPGKERTGKEGLSFLVQLHFASAMYGYLQLKVVRCDPGWQIRSQSRLVGRIIVFFKDIKGIGYDVIDADHAQAELARANIRVIPTSDCLKLIITTPQINLDLSAHKDSRIFTDTRGLREIVSLGNEIAGLIKLELFIPVQTEDMRNEGLSLCHVLEKGVKADKSKKFKKWPLAPWFSRANSEARRLSFEDVPRLGKNFPQTPPQKALACFVDLEHYIVTHAVGAVNATLTTQLPTNPTK